MDRSVIKLGYLPTRRNNFPKEYAQFFRDEIYKKISSFPGVSVVDIKDINADGICDEMSDVEKIINKFKTEEIEALFIPHCNFGSEVLVSDIAAAFRLPTLLWGPRDDAPDDEGMRFRDSQCGLFATSKVLRRHNIPFTYINNVSLDSDVFTAGFDRFLRVAEVVKTARNLRILQIGTRPTAFYTVIINESELMEKFGAQVIPFALSDVTKEVLKLSESKDEEYLELIKYIVDGLVIKSLSLKDIWACVKKTAVLTGSIMLIATSSAIMNYLIAFEGVPALILNILTSVPGGKIGFLVVMIIILIAIGMTIDVTPAILIFAPLFLPAAVKLGIDPSHFIIFMVTALAMGLTTPPYGVCIFSVAAVSGVPVGRLGKQAMPFYLVMFISLLIIAFIPGVALVVPRFLAI